MIGEGLDQIQQEVEAIVVYFFEVGLEFVGVALLEFLLNETKFF